MVRSSDVPEREPPKTTNVFYDDAKHETSRKLAEAYVVLNSDKYNQNGEAKRWVNVYTKAFDLALERAPNENGGSLLDYITQSDIDRIMGEANG